MKRRLLVIALSAAAIAVACSSGTHHDAPLYFSTVAGLAVTLETAHGPTEADLRAFAAGLDALDPPQLAKDAHHDLTVASKNLADDAGRASTAVAAGTDSVFVRDWETACHVLQDVALAGKIDVDLRCATALHGG